MKRSIRHKQVVNLRKKIDEKTTTRNEKGNRATDIMENKSVTAHEE